MTDTTPAVRATVRGAGAQVAKGVAAGNDDVSAREVEAGAEVARRNAEAELEIVRSSEDPVPGREAERVRGIGGTGEPISSIPDFD